MTTTSEWKSELEQLRRLPFERGVRWRYWEAELARFKRELPARASSYSPRPSPTLVRRMTPKERAELHEGHPFHQKTQILRCGRNSWHVIEPDRGVDTRIRVY
jgi:hypothetical protein